MSRRRTREGYLTVKQAGRSAFGKSWKRKWVVVHPNNTRSQVGELASPSIVLELYLEKGVYGKVNSVLIEDATEVNRICSKSQPLSFEIRGKDKVIISAAAESETETQEWIAMFKQQLLPVIRKKELSRLPHASEDSYTVAIIPNKYSDGLQLSGSMLAHVAKMTIGLHDLYEGTLIREWDLRHTKRFSLESKVPAKDVDRVAVIQISNRCPHGEGVLQLYSLNVKALLEMIYEKLNTAMNVKSKRTRTSSMLFEIPPKELEALGREIKDETPTNDEVFANNGVTKDSENVAPQKGETVPLVNAASQLSEKGDHVDIATETENDKTSEASASSDQKEVSGLDVAGVVKVEPPSEEKSKTEKDDQLKEGNGKENGTVASNASAEAERQDDKTTEDDVKSSGGITDVATDVATDITDKKDSDVTDASNGTSKKVDDTQDVPDVNEEKTTGAKDATNNEEHETDATNKEVKLDVIPEKNEELPETVNAISEAAESNEGDSISNVAEHSVESNQDVSEHREEEGEKSFEKADEEKESTDVIEVKEVKDGQDVDLSNTGPSESKDDKPSICEEEESMKRNEPVESEQCPVVVDEKEDGDISESKDDDEQNVEKETTESSEIKTNEPENDTKEESQLECEDENKEGNVTNTTLSENVEASVKDEEVAEPTKPDDTLNRTDDAGAVEVNKEDTAITSVESQENHITDESTVVTPSESGQDSTVKEETVDSTKQPESSTTTDNPKED